MALTAYLDHYAQRACARIRKSNAMAHWRRRPFGASSGLRVLLISVDDAIAESQIHPFHYYASDLRARFGAQLREVRLGEFERRASVSPRNADLVCFQTWFDRSEQDMHSLIRRIREQNPRARLVYLDCFAPTDLRFARILDPHVDFYVKKHVLRARSQYGLATIGDTNLTDFYARRFELSMPKVRFSIPDRFLQKLIVGPSFPTADYLIPRFERGLAPDRSRSIDVHARISTKGTDWYGRMREEAIAALNPLSDLEIVTGNGVDQARYFAELESSKLCFSPFGYGEVCWRDFEAVSAGAVLLKPDMSHIETKPDIFEPYVTYVPLRWDLADLDEKVRACLADVSMRRRIASAAFERVRHYLSSGKFCDTISPLFARERTARKHSLLRSEVAALGPLICCSLSNAAYLL